MYPFIEYHILHTSNAHTETSQVIVIKKLIDWFLYDPQEYENLKTQWIYQ